MRTAKDVDDYIATAPEYTRSILVKLRRIFQQASPKLGEAIKWGVPCFEYKGPVAGFAAYTKHVSWGLWNAKLLDDPDGLLGRGILRGGKITKLSEIPPASKLARLIKQVMALNEADDLARAAKKSGKAARKPSARKRGPKRRQSSYAR